MSEQYRVAALYKFVDVDDKATMRQEIEDACNDAGVKGTLLIADEGINGTIAGSDRGIETVLSFLRRYSILADLEHKDSFADEMPFYRMKVRLKKEIVTLGAPEAKPCECVGTYVEPERWNELISDPDVVVVDTRNDYEVAIGTFKGAVDPHTRSFRDFPSWFDAQNYDRSQKIAMFCTGGIRCEKSTSLLKSRGFEEVFHLRGGILKYLETVPKARSLWRGQCFVFDQRVSVGHGLQIGEYDLCHACRRPIDEQDKTSGEYVEGVSCPHCASSTSESQRQRYAERQRQMELSETRGDAHLGMDLDDERRRAHERQSAQIEASRRGAEEAQP